MTRNEVKKQFSSGWLTNLAAMAALNLSLDTFDHLTRQGIVSTKADRGRTLYSASDVLSYGDTTVKEVLDRHWPVDRRKKPTRRQRRNALKTQTERELFHRAWFRLHRHVSRLIATPAAGLGIAELKLIHQLMALAYKSKSFSLVLTVKQLEQATGLDDRSLPKARRTLEGNIISVDTSSSPWMYELIDPKTGRPFADGADNEEIVVVPHESWAHLG